MPINTVDHSVGRMPGELFGVVTALQSDELFTCDWPKGEFSRAAKRDAGRVADGRPAKQIRMNGT